MYGELGCVALLSLLLGCTGLNPSYGAGTGGEGDSEPGATTPPDPSLPSGPGETTSPTSESTVGPTGGEASSDPTAQTGPGTGDSGSSSEDTGGGSVTGPNPGVCSTYDQDCPSGDDKCMPWADDGGVVWNALGCFPLDPNPHSLGESCTVEGTATSGVDNCDVSSMCWNVETRTNMGTCISFCEGSPDSPGCADSITTCVQSGDVIAVCVPSCDPLLGDCSEGLACLPSVDAFGCVPDASGGTAQVGDACEFVNTCGLGNLCVPSAELVGCLSAACCTVVCDLSEGNTCNKPSVCLPFYADGLAPQGYENVGYCGAA